MNKPTLWLFVLAIWVQGWSMTAFAQNDPAPSITTIPSPPVSGQPFTVVASFLGGAPSNAFTFYSIGGPFDNFAGEIWLSGSPTYPYVNGSVSVVVPAQPAGTYLIDFVNAAFSPVPTMPHSWLTSLTPAQLVLCPLFR